MGTRETRGGPVRAKRTGLGERLNPGNTQGVAFTQHGEVPSDAGQHISVRKVGAPFFLTGMRARRGGGWRLMWLWSRRGSQWVIEQELNFKQRARVRPMLGTRLLKSRGFRLRTLPKLFEDA